MARTSSNLVAPAWKYYQRHGLLRLLRAASGELYRLVPFRYRLAYRTRVNGLKYGAGAVSRPLKVHWIDPDRVRYNGPIFSHDKCVGTVRDGEWDEAPSKITEEAMYVGLSERFSKGRDWGDTRYYALAKRNFESDGEWLGYTSFESFRDNRLPYLDRMFEDIKRNGYKTQSELEPDSRDGQRHGSVPAYHDEINEIACNIARDGELLLNNGIHRISIAKLLELDEIPVQIIVRHREWQETRTAVVKSDRPARTARNRGVEPTHPDLEALH